MNINTDCLNIAEIKIKIELSVFHLSDGYPSQLYTTGDILSTSDMYLGPVVIRQVPKPSHEMWLQTAVHDFFFKGLY